MNKTKVVEKATIKEGGHKKGGVRTTFSMDSELKAYLRIIQELLDLHSMHATFEFVLKDYIEHHPLHNHIEYLKKVKDVKPEVKTRALAELSKMKPEDFEIALETH